MARSKFLTEEQIEKRKAYKKAYYLENKEVIRATKKKYQKTEKGRLARARSKRKLTENLTDGYVRECIASKYYKQGIRISREDITPEMVELQREAIILKRIEKSYTS